MKGMGLATAGLTLAPVDLLAAKKKVQPAPAPKSEKVKIAYIGIGNRGQQNIDEFAKTNMVEVVALCDVDLQGKQCQKVLNMYPNAKRYTDFRKLFDEYSDHFDAVAISVPDHTHFFVCMAAMKHGKHVYCEKPLIRTFQEGEILIEMANRHPELATQVGNQGHSEANYFQFKAWMEAGIIKDVTKVVAHMNNDRRWHKYDWNMKKMPEGDPIPAGMDYDTWHGGVRYHNFSNLYHQGDWRSWYDFGMGALGDWGAHLLDTVHEFGRSRAIDVQALDARGSVDVIEARLRFERRQLLEMHLLERVELALILVELHVRLADLPAEKAFGQMSVIERAHSRPL